MTDIYIISVVLDDVVGLRRTAKSILGQTDTTPYWIIADGGSTDGSAAMAKQLQERYERVFFLGGPDRGIYHGMNRAVKMVPDTALVWFLNAGDFFLSQHSVAKARAATPATGWSGGPMVLVGESGAIHDITSVPSLAPSHHRPGIQLPAQPTILMAKTLFEVAGPFREDLRFASDGVLYQNLAKVIPPAVRQEPLVGFTLGGRSSRHFRQTLLEFWSAGYRPSSRATRIADRDVGQARTWVRGMKLKLSAPVQRLSTPRAAEGLPFEHWSEHNNSGRDLNCCLTMGQGLPALGMESN
jgi:hypothetical protein